ncbi:hypothetical protein CHS0354_019613 [Potamilus streckersoni]|uniref:Dual oxidase maturation factor 1 n=1 Tax=Potamilus streckersoni TaxID=2493646 RepID=A0AAE0T9K3_9BIVA|nr:hypothetical protein CHS0354_019613 [Potamilus streckersoni]
MAWFNAFRNEFGFAHYGEQRVPVLLDVPLTVAIYVCLCISIAFLIAAAGIRGKERWCTLIRVAYSLLIGSIIFVSIHGYCWQITYKDIKAPYVYRSDSYIDGKIGIRIGLYTVNITLSGNFEGNKVDYNEEFLLEDISGPAIELYHALDRGLPHPIVMVLQHFNTDDGGLRFGRSCRFAGYFAGILLWTAFAFWIASNIILCSVVWHGAVCLTASGVCMILAAVVYQHLSLYLGFRLPGSQGEVLLHHGWCLWFNLTLGILTTLFGIIIIMADYKYPKKVAAFFLLETALEDWSKDYSYRYSASLVQDYKNNDMRYTALSNRFLKYSFNSSLSQKKNHIFGGSNSDLSTTIGSDSAYTSGGRLSRTGNDTISVNSTNEVVQRDNTFKETRTDSSLNMLTEICVDAKLIGFDMNITKSSAADKSVDITNKDTMPDIVHTENNSQINNGTKDTHLKKFTDECEDR